MARIRWEFVAGDNAAPKIGGEDIAVVVDGRIQKMYTFLDF